MDAHQTYVGSNPHPLITTIPKQAMWDKLKVDYIPSPHPSHITCQAPNHNRPSPMMQAVAEFNSCLISTTIPCLAVAHCFDTDYSNHFQPAANDETTCPCTHIP